MIKQAIALTFITTTAAFAGNAEPHPDKDIQCLAQAIYFEAGSDYWDTEHRMNVGWVIMNRAESKYYPNTLCGVVQQANRDDKGNIKKNQCAFSYYCDGKPDVVPNKAKELVAWERAKDVAELIVDQSVTGVKDPTKGADHYHTPYVDPYWKDETKQTISDGAHIFYSFYEE